MKVRISYTVDLDNDVRAGLANYYGIDVDTPMREMAEWLRRFMQHHAEADLQVAISDAMGDGS